MCIAAGGTQAGLSPYRGVGGPSSTDCTDCLVGRGGLQGGCNLVSGSGKASPWG